MTVKDQKIKRLRKHTYSNILKLYNQKRGFFFFQIKNSDIFHIPAQNIDCGYSLEPPCRDGSNKCTQSIFFGAEIRNIMYTPVNPIYYTCIKVVFKGVKII